MYRNSAGVAPAGKAYVVKPVEGIERDEKHWEEFAGYLGMWG